MKKVAILGGIGIALAAALAASSAYAFEVYNANGTSIDIGGRIEGTAQLNSEGDYTGDLSRVRFNMDVTQELDNGLKGHGFFEQQFSTGGDTELRDAYVGIGKGSHMIYYGRMGSAMGMITDYTDVMAYHGASAGQKVGAIDKVDSGAHYLYNNGAFSAKASLSLDDVAEGGSIAAKYSFGKFSVGAGAGMNSTFDIDHQQYMAGASWTGESLYLGAMATVKTGDVEYTGYEVAGKYNIGKTTFGLSYEDGSYDEGRFDLLPSGKSVVEVGNITADVSYQFSDHMVGYVSAVYNTDSNGTSEDPDAKGVVGLKLTM